MEDSRRHRFSSSDVDLQRPTLERFGSVNPSNRPASYRNGSLDNTYDRSALFSPSMSRRTRPSLAGEGLKAYPLPRPSEVDTSSNVAPPPSDANDILFPLQSFRRFTGREKVDEAVSEVRRPSHHQPPTEAFKEPGPTSSVFDTDKQPWFESDVDKGQIQEVESARHEVEELATLREEDPVDAQQDDEEESTVVRANKLVVVHDAEKKFSTAALDIAINSHAKAEGDTILVLAFLEHVMSPMGNKMVADLKQFGGANAPAINNAIIVKRAAIIKTLGQKHSRVCQERKVNTSHSFISVRDEYFPERIASVL